jgi:ubiquitin-protein ligase
MATPSSSAAMNMDHINLDSCSEKIKDFKIATEYKFLITGAPAGVYLLPEFQDIRKLHGVIFVRSGLYKNGVFRFRIDLPPTYNDINTHPLVTFTPPIFNPLVHMSTGKLELTSDDSMREWKPDQHFLVTCVTFLKKTFMAKSYDEYNNIPNEEARML